MKIMIVVGARPNFMKAAPIMEAMARHNASVTKSASAGPRIEFTLVHTGQHYDSRMSDAFFSDLNLPQPDVFLGVGSGAHGAQTAEIMKRFEEVLAKDYPDIVMVAGDVNSTIACALVASKMPATAGRPRPLIAHVEAGLRSFDRSMPEEINRVLTDHISDLLFVTEESGLRNLAKEGISSDKIFFVGNTMIDSLLAAQKKVETSTVLDRLQLRAPVNGNGSRKIKPYALLTLHRPANVDNRESLEEILEGLKDLAASHAIIFPAHPRTQKQIEQNGLQSYFNLAAQSPSGISGEPHGISLIEPQGYLDFQSLMKYARIVVTDSGGIQEETTGLGVACVTVRENTERPVTVDTGTNILAGVRRDGIRQAIRRQLERTGPHTVPKFWDGAAAGRIVEVLVRHAPEKLQKGHSL
jgi:UDP-N-acetylglucosamine 2-epimerase (non-hydrolysing)